MGFVKYGVIIGLFLAALWCIDVYFHLTNDYIPW